MSDTSSAARTGYIDPMEMVLGDAEARLAAVKASYERENAALRARVTELEAERDAALHNEAVAMDSEAKLLDRLATPAAPSEPVACEKCLTITKRADGSCLLCAARDAWNDGTPTAPADGLCAPCLSDQPCPRHGLAAVPSEPVAWAAVKDGGAVGDGRIWRHRDKAERFVANMGSYAMQQPRLGYEIVPLYARPAAPSEPVALPTVCPMYGAKVSAFREDEGRVRVTAWYATWDRANAAFDFLTRARPAPREGVTEAKVALMEALRDAMKVGVPEGCNATDAIRWLTATLAKLEAP